MAASLMEDLIANRFAKLRGLQISGTVPLQQELVNQALSELVENRASAGAEPQQPPQVKPRLSATDMLGLVKRIQVRAEPGVIHVDFEIGV